MAQINNKGDLDTALSNWFGARGDFAASAYDDDFVALCEDRIHHDLRVRAMERQHDIALTARRDIAAAQVSDSGTAVTLTNSTALTANVIGHNYGWEIETTNTGAVDITIDSITAVNLYKGGTTELVADDLIAGHQANAYFDGSNFHLVPHGGVPLPTRFLQHRRLYLDTAGNRRLHYLTPEEFWTRKASNQEGTPRVFTIEGEYIVFGPRADRNLSAKLLFYQGFARLSAGTDTNWIFDNARGLYLYGSLLEASVFLNDDNAAKKYGQLYSEALSRVQAMDQRDRTPSAVTARSDIPVSGGV